MKEKLIFSFSYMLFVIVLILEVSVINYNTATCHITLGYDTYFIHLYN